MTTTPTTDTEQDGAPQTEQAVAPGSEATAPSAPQRAGEAPSLRAPRKGSRLAGLDGLRFAAAALVLLFHFTGINRPYWGQPPHDEFPGLNLVTRYGWIGVQIFFVISGFVILMTAYGRTVSQFASSRVARLFPAYWAAIAITVVLQSLWDGGRHPDKMDALLNFTMLHEAWDATAVQGAFWTLWVELKFYLLVGVFILVGITRRRIVAFAVLWPVIGQIAAATDTRFLESLLVPTYAPFFAVGMLLYLVYRDGGDLLVWLGIALSTILCVRQVRGYAFHVSGEVGATVNSGVSIAIILGTIAVVWALSAGPLNRIRWPFLSTLGALTYPLYLVHAQFGFWVIDELHGRLPKYVVLSLAATLALVLAAALHYGVENRVHDRLRAAVRRSLERDGVDQPRAAATGR